MRTRIVFSLTGIVLVLLLSFLFYREVYPPFDFYVKNGNKEVMARVRLEVSGKTYSLGNIIPGTSKSIRVANTEGFSLGDVIYIDSARQEKIVPIRNWHPRGRGELEFTIESGQLVHVRG